MEQCWDELHKFTEHAERLLANPDLLLDRQDLSSFHIELRLWHYPSFDPWTVWLLCRNAQNGLSHQVREIVWDKESDSNRFIDPLQKLKHGIPQEPDFRIRVAALAPDEIEPRLAELRKMSFPAFMEPDSIGCDGETYGIASDPGFLNAGISWWCEGPDEWGEVTRWFNRMRDYLTAQLDAAPV